MKCANLFLPLFFGILFFCPTIVFAQNTKKEEPPPTLTAADEKFLSTLLEKHLVDPKGMQRVVTPYEYRTPTGSVVAGKKVGWLYQRGQRTRVYFADGDWTAVTKPDKLRKIDYMAMCQKRFGKPLPKKDDPSAALSGWEDRFARMKAISLGAIQEPAVVHAAWLYRLGHKQLAAQVLQWARLRWQRGDKTVSNEFLLARMNDDLAWNAFAGMVHAFIVRADDDALRDGQRLLRLYPAEAKKYPQAAAIMADLKRRQDKGNLGKNSAADLPKDFAQWEMQKKLTFLVDALEEVDARQHAQPGGVDLVSDWRVQELIKLGDKAVPALIDVIEKDNRLTRSLHFWRDFARARTVLQVREPALVAVMSILQTRFFQPASTGDDFTLTLLHREGYVRRVVAELREYWKKYGKYSFDERMMKILTDPKSAFDAKRDAAYNLATLGQKRTISTMFSAPVFNKRKKRQGPNPAVKKFSNPTTAEAILAAMQKDLAAHDGKNHDARYDYERQRIEDHYFNALVELGDKRIAPELVRRAGAATVPRMKREWALAAYLLGAKDAFKKYIHDFEQGKITPAAVKNAGGDPKRELGDIIRFLFGSRLPEANRALQALAGPKHPFAKIAAQQVLAGNPGNVDDQIWFASPFCLAILRRELENKKPTGTIHMIHQDRLEYRDKTGAAVSGPIPKILSDPKQRQELVPERFCDRAALQLSELVFGMPAFHPLQKDADQRIMNMKKIMDRFKGKFQQMPNYLRKALAIRFGPRFIAVPEPLDHPATAKDVAEGRAIFQLKGKGKLAEKQLPMTAILKSDAASKNPSRVLIVQAERQPDGQVIYGIIGPHQLRGVAATELTKLTPLKK